MIEQKKSIRTGSRTKRRSNKIFYFFIASVILFVIIFYFYTKKISINAQSNNQEFPATTPAEASQPDHTLKTQPTNKLRDNPLVSTTNIPDSTPSPNNLPVQSTTEQITAEKSSINTEDFNEEKSEEPAIENRPALLIQRLNDFYKHLDQQPYMVDFKLKESSSVHFSRLLQKLVATPPVVTNETDDLFTLLKNTAHFFRILGKDNILILKGILDREKSSFEDILKVFYNLTEYPEAMLEEYSLKLPKDSLYDYAGFFLNTMGGRLYLFRRDSSSRMTVSFYALLIIDKANDEEYNRHGIDIKPAIDFLIDEIENTGKRLLLKEDYLDVLYDLKEKYD